MSPLYAQTTAPFTRMDPGYPKAAARAIRIFVLNGKHLESGCPIGRLSRHSIAFTNSEQVTSLTTGKMGDLMRADSPCGNLSDTVRLSWKNGFKI